MWWYVHVFWCMSYSSRLWGKLVPHSYLWDESHLINYLYVLHLYLKVCNTHQHSTSSPPFDVKYIPDISWRKNRPCHLSFSFRNERKTSPPVVDDIICSVPAYQTWWGKRQWKRFELELERQAFTYLINNLEVLVDIFLSFIWHFLFLSHPDNRIKKTFRRLTNILSEVSHGNERGRL